jgi:LuxR family transcriptional regulator, maltose regulon positive regulatory protein
MSSMILATKLYLPQPRPQRVLRPHLVKQLNDGLAHKLTLVSAPAGFGKSTLISEWAAGCGRRVAWLSLDEGDNEVTRFLAYLIAALQTIEPEIGAGVLRLLRSPQLPPLDVILGTLLNEVTTIPDQFVLILDDYHLIDARPIDDAITFLLKHLPPQMHLVIATREDPSIPLARLRARGELTEVRAADLRFTYAETAGFLNQIMGLKLSPEEIAALESRTEGWIAGLQLAALSMQGRNDAAGFIKSFTGSHHFVLDYLIEEVLDQQPASVQSFLLRSSILDRMCGPLCDAVLQGEGDPNSVAAGAGQETLHYLERANLFVIPLDNERRWYRYHHLFGDLLRQRLLQSYPGLAGEPRGGVAQYHVRASEWFEENGLEIEAFQHAAAAHDIARAERLMEGNGMPLLFRGAVAPVSNWLASLPAAVLDARPGLWVMYASALLFVGQLAGVEQKLQAAEAALQDAKQDDRSRDLIGHIASIRATLAVTQHEVENIVFQSRRALEYLAPSNLPVRTATTWTLGYAYHLQGDRAAAGQAYDEAIAISQSIGHFIINMMATLGLGNLQEMDNQLAQAAASYQHVLELAGDPPLPVACGAHLGLARIHYEWNELDAAHEHAQRGVHLARQLAATDRRVACDLFLARLKLAEGDATGAAEILAAAEQAVQQHNFVQRIPEVGAAQVRVLLQQGNPAAAAQIAQRLGLPISQARVHLALGEAPAALAVLAPLSRQAEAKRWPDERLKVMILQAIALQACGEAEEAVQLLSQALALGEPGGFVRVFVDEGLPLAHLLSTAAARGIMPSYTGRLLAAFAAEERNRHTESNRSTAATVQTLAEPLSERELEILQLIAQGLSNHEIGERLFIALDTVKGHNRRIFEKLQVQRRTEAVARARSLNLLPFSDNNTRDNT